MARRLEAGETASQALATLDPARRRILSPLITAARIGPETRDLSVLVLRAVEAARAQGSRTAPVWTIPERGRGVSLNGTLTATLSSLVDGAARSVTCSTFNLAQTSGLWAALQRAAKRPGMSVRLYMDADVADGQFVADSRVVSTSQAAMHLDRAVVLRPTADGRGRRFRNHAKLVIVDRQILVVTSANLSYSAEQMNIELGLRLQDPLLACAIEDQLRELEEAGLYERVGICSVGGDA